MSQTIRLSPVYHPLLASMTQRPELTIWILFLSYYFWLLVSIFSPLYKHVFPFTEISGLSFVFVLLRHSSYLFLCRCRIFNNPTHYNNAKFHLSISCMCACLDKPWAECMLRIWYNDVFKSPTITASLSWLLNSVCV